MFPALSSSLNGLSRAVSSATQSAGNVVNASSTGKNIDSDIVKFGIAKTVYSANAAAIRAEDKMHEALLDILA